MAISAHMQRAITQPLGMLGKVLVHLLVLNLLLLLPLLEPSFRISVKSVDPYLDPLRVKR